MVAEEDCRRMAPYPPSLPPSPPSFPPTPLREKLLSYCPRGYQSHALCELHFGRHHHNMSHIEGLARFKEQGQPRLRLEDEEEEEEGKEGGGVKKKKEGKEGKEGDDGGKEGGRGRGGGEGGRGRGGGEGAGEELTTFSSSSSPPPGSTTEGTETAAAGGGGGTNSSITTSPPPPPTATHPLCVVCALLCPCKPCRRASVRRALDILRRTLNIKAGRAATDDGDLLSLLTSHPHALSRTGPLMVEHSLIAEDVRRVFTGQAEEGSVFRTTTKNLLKHSVDPALLPPLGGFRPPHAMDAPAAAAAPAAPAAAATGRGLASFPALLLPSLDVPLLLTLQSYLQAIDKASRGLAPPPRPVPTSRLTPAAKKEARLASRLRQRATAKASRQAKRQAKQAARILAHAAVAEGYPFPPSLHPQHYPSFIADVTAAVAGGGGGPFPPSLPPFPPGFEAGKYLASMRGATAEALGVAGGGDAGGGGGMEGGSAASLALILQGVKPGFDPLSRAGGGGEEGMGGEGRG